MILRVAIIFRRFEQFFEIGRRKTYKCLIYFSPKINRRIYFLFFLFRLFIYLFILFIYLFLIGGVERKFRKSHLIPSKHLPVQNHQ